MFFLFLLHSKGIRVDLVQKKKSEPPINSTHVQTVMHIGITQHVHNARLENTDENNRMRAAARPIYSLAAQATKLPPSGSLRVGGGSPKTAHAQ